MLALPAPFPVTYRELWLPRGINENASLPTSVEGGHGLAFTGARRATTVDGVHFDGTATSNINCGAIHNAAAKLWISFRFKLDQPFDNTSAAVMFPFGKRQIANDRLYIYINNTNGSLNFRHVIGGAEQFNLPSAETSWEAGRWYHVLASLGQAMGGGAASNGARMRIDNGVAITNANAAAIANVGDFVIGDEDDPGAGFGFKGVIADFFCGTDDLTEAEETDLFNGIPPADVVNEYLLDEGRGVTAYDRGSGGNNGTLDTTATWKFGQVEAPVISFDSINDVAISSVGVNLAQPVTAVIVLKMKSAYDSISRDFCMFYSLYIDGNNRLEFYSAQGADAMAFNWVGAGVSIQVNFVPSHVIDDYNIFVVTYSAAGVLSAYLQGSLIEDVTGGQVLPAAGATVYLGRWFNASRYDISKPLMAALIDGAFNQAQVLAYSRYLKKVFNLPITI